MGIAMKKHFLVFTLCALLGAIALFPATALANDGGTCDDGFAIQHAIHYGWGSR